METETGQKPDLRSYLNIHHYLEDLYKFRKRTEPGFSYDCWAAELGLGNRSFLRQIVVGRRSLTERMTQQFCDRMGLEKTDRQYFEYLVLYSNAAKQEERNLYGRQLMLLLKTDYQQTEIENYYELVSTPLHPKILTLLSFRDIRKDTKNLARLLSASEEDVEKGIAVLLRLGLVRQNPETDEYESTQQSVKIPDKIGDGALLDFHAQSLQEAIAARNLPKDQRRYKALLLPLSGDEFSEFLEDLQVFTKQSMKKFEKDDLRSRKLHQINFNIYAVSEEPEEIAPESEL